jgi:hypothetical protein
VVGELLVEADEVHLAAGAGEVAIERDVSELDDRAHVLVLSPGRRTTQAAID